MVPQRSSRHLFVLGSLIVVYPPMSGAVPPQRDRISIQPQRPPRFRQHFNATLPVRTITSRAEHSTAINIPSSLLNYIYHSNDAVAVASKTTKITYVEHVMKTGGAPMPVQLSWWLRTWKKMWLEIAEWQVRRISSMPAKIRWRASSTKNIECMGLCGCMRQGG